MISVFRYNVFKWHIFVYFHIQIAWRKSNDTTRTRRPLTSCQSAAPISHSNQTEHDDDVNNNLLNAFIYHNLNAFIIYTMYILRLTQNKDEMQY